MEENKNQEITNFIKFLIESTSIYKVNENNLVISRSDDDLIELTLDDNIKKNIQIFSIPYTNNDNNIILNPFNETLQKTTDKKWFYTSLALSISMKLQRMLISLVECYEIQDSLPIGQIKELSPYLSYIDNKTENEIKKITSDLISFANIYYNKKIRLAYFRTGIYENSFLQKHKTIRKKTKSLIDKFISNLFDIEETDIENKRILLKEKYSFKTNEITCPEFISFINVYYNILDKINTQAEYLALDDYVVDMSQFVYYIKNIDEYYRKTKWLSQTNTQEIKSESSGIIPSDNQIINNSIIPNTQPSVIEDNSSSIIPPGYDFNRLNYQNNGFNNFNQQMLPTQGIFPGTIPVNQNNYISNNNNFGMFPNQLNQCPF